MMIDAKEVCVNLKSQPLAPAGVEQSLDQTAHRLRAASHAILSVSSDYFLANLDSLHARMFARRLSH